ncbi:FecR family protein [Pontimicrobium aquaticum]|uniref:DUF4974 domain-containing protein n=1 Tax=Pontimicrobium aquaticum TaxID=2565367 RepID=A0A4U0EMN5_9FLAO|nr:FecR domain-containing protein [Pontimicrobium aquaticum]TJY32843.1 DUF4974 domain-containing protein [Pontimicrobium aquaticum]
MEEHIIKYLTGTISNKELNDLKNWVQAPENKKLFLDFVKTNQELDLAYSLIDTDLAFLQVKRLITSKESRPFIRVLKYAAIILLFFSIGFSFYSSFVKDENLTKNNIALRLGNGDLKVIDERKEIEIRNHKGDIIARYDGEVLLYVIGVNKDFKNTHHELTVSYGKQFTVQLSDGSLVFVNSGSKLEFPIALNNKATRNVFLEGEAFFEVKKNKLAPFIVHTKDMNVQVLGTKFNVLSYQNDKNTSVVLKEGSVGITKSSEAFNKKNGVVITSGEQVVFEDDTFLVNKVSVEKYVAWKDGYLFFKNDKFEDIIKKLERYYNIDIENDYVELNDIRFTGSFTKEPVNEVLDVFTELSPFKYQVNGNKVVIKSIVK